MHEYLAPYMDKNVGKMTAKWLIADCCPKLIEFRQRFSVIRTITRNTPRTENLTIMEIQRVMDFGMARTEIPYSAGR